MAHSSPPLAMCFFIRFPFWKREGRGGKELGVGIALPFLHSPSGEEGRGRYINLFGSPFSVSAELHLYTIQYSTKKEQGEIVSALTGERVHAAAAHIFGHCVSTIVTHDQAPLIR